jgi:hypothetical protein
VHAIFDNGTNRVLPSHFLIPEEGTIGDAVRCFNVHHARDLWRVREVELLGIVPEDSLLNRQASMSLAPMASKLRDMMEPNDFLVFRSARRGGNVPAATVSEQDAQEGEEDEDGESKDIETEEEVSEEDQEQEFPPNTRKISTSNKKSRSSRRGSDEVSRLQKRISSELRRLQDHLAPPLMELQRKRTKTSQYDPQASVAASKWNSDVPSTERPCEKRSRKTRTHFDPEVEDSDSRWRSNDATYNEHEARPTKRAMIDKTEITPLPSRRESPPRSTSTSRRIIGSTGTQRSNYGAGTRHFYQWRDGMEYPVKVQKANRNKRLKSNERIVAFEGCKTTRRVITSQLLPVSREREERFQNAKNLAAHVAREKQEQEKLKKERRRNQKRVVKEKARENEKRRMLKARAERSERERQLYGNRTSCKGPFPDCDEPGTLIVQETRRVYFAVDDETPSDIAGKFDVSVGKIIYDNQWKYRTLKRMSRLKSLTAIVLPLEETGEEPGTGRNSWQQEEVCGSDSDSSFVIYSR